MNEDEPAGGLTGDRPPRGYDEGSVGGQAQQRIGLHLRALYDSVVQQPIPDRFRDLIARLDDSGSTPEDPAEAS